MSSGVIALGACNGSGVNSISATGTERHETFVEARFGTGWHDAAVAAYKPFRFVVCFENSWTTEGYITEKVLQDGDCYRPGGRDYVLSGLQCRQSLLAIVS
jgi:hypothetical protein